MSIWWLIPAFVGLVGLMSLVGGFFSILRLKVFSGATRFLFGGLVLSGAAVIGLIGLNLQTYSRLTAEQLAAEVELKADPGVPGGFIASVKRADEGGMLGKAEDFPLTGDSFRMEADVITFKPWANIVGADALYRFDRIQGRFDSEAQEKATPPEPHRLRDEAGLDPFALPLGPANPFLKADAEFVDGFAVPMADGAIYEVHMSQKGMVPRPKNREAEQAIETRRQGRKSGEIYQAPVDLTPQP
jgi:hypothetical protein